MTAKVRCSTLIAGLELDPVVALRSQQKAQSKAVCMTPIGLSGEHEEDAVAAGSTNLYAMLSKHTDALPSTLQRVAKFTSQMSQAQTIKPTSPPNQSKALRVRLPGDSGICAALGWLSTVFDCKGLVYSSCA